jgi:hypothetical protein
MHKRTERVNVGLAAAAAWFTKRHLTRGNAGRILAGSRMVLVEDAILGLLTPDIHVLISRAKMESDEVIVATRSASLLPEKVCEAILRARSMKAFSYESWLLYPTRVLGEATEAIRGFLKAECDAHGIGILAVPANAGDGGVIEEILPARTHREGAEAIQATGYFGFDRLLMLSVAGAIRFLDELHAALATRFSEEDPSIKEIQIVPGGGWRCAVEGYGDRSYTIDVQPGCGGKVTFDYGFYAGTKPADYSFVKEFPAGDAIIPGLLDYIETSIRATEKSEVCKSEEREKRMRDWFMHEGPVPR